MRRWPDTLRSLRHDEIMTAIDDDDWQTFRKSLKGLPTEDKLDQLYHYLHKFFEESETNYGEFFVREIRVVNYLNALKRGGQLNYNLEVVR